METNEKGLVTFEAYLIYRGICLRDGSFKKSAWQATYDALIPTMQVQHDADVKAVKEIVNPFSPDIQGHTYEGFERARWDILAALKAEVKHGD